MLISLSIILLLPFLLFGGLMAKSYLLLEDYSVIDLLFSRDWQPMSGKFGFLPFIISSLWVTALSILIAGPVCLLTSIHLTQYAKPYVLKIMQQKYNRKLF